MYVLGPHDCWALRIVQFEGFLQRVFCQKSFIFIFSKMQNRWNQEAQLSAAYPSSFALCVAKEDRGGADLFQLAGGGTFRMSRDEKEEKQESKRKTAPDWNGNTNTGTRPHLCTPTPATFFPSQTLFKVLLGYRSYIRQTLYALCLCRRCEFASQRSPGGDLVPCCQ